MNAHSSIDTESSTSEAEFIILGAGGSTGVPSIGNIWGECDPSNPKNLRSRTSGLIKFKNKNVIIDTGPDFKLQANRENIDKIDAVLYTHDHGDHTNGIDELRVYKNLHGFNIPAFGSDETLLSVESRHSHMFESRSEFYPSVVDKHMLYARDMGKPFEAVEGLSVIPFEMQHGNIMSTGYRIGDLAYCADMSSIPEHSMTSLEGVKTLVVDAAGFPFKNGKVHANYECIKHLQNLIKPKETYLTVLSVLLDYDELDSKTPVNTMPAYDGLTIKIQF